MKISSSFTSFLLSLALQGALLVAPARSYNPDMLGVRVVLKHPQERQQQPESDVEPCGDFEDQGVMRGYLHRAIARANRRRNLRAQQQRQLTTAPSHAKLSRRVSATWSIPIVGDGEHVS